MKQKTVLVVMLGLEHGPAFKASAVYHSVERTI